MKAFFQTDKSRAGLILRVMLGTVMFPYGAQKMLGWYGGGKWSLDRVIAANLEN